MSPSLAQGAVPSLLYSINIFFAPLKVPLAPVTINSVNGTDVSELEPVSGYTQVARNEPLGVTILTSLDNDDIKTIGYSNNTKDQVMKMASLCYDSGLNGIVCSAHEAKNIKNKLALPRGI